MGHPMVLYQKFPVKTLTQFLIITLFYKFVKKMKNNYIFISMKCACKRGQTVVFL